MPQMFNIQPVAPQTTPQRPAGKKEQSPFSPHLEDAISGKKQEKPAKTANATTNTTEGSEQSQEPLETQLEGQLSDSTDQDIAIEIKEEKTEQTGLAAYNTEFVAPTGSSDLDSNHKSSSPALVIKPEAAETAKQSHNQEIIVPSKYNPDQAESSLAPESPASQNSFKYIGMSRQDALINQLQQIIDKADETGIVSVTRAKPAYSFNTINTNLHGVLTTSIPEAPEAAAVSPSTELTAASFNELLVKDLDNNQKPAIKPLAHLSGGRQGIHQQYFNAKVSNQNLSDNNQDLQQKKQGEEFLQNTIAGNLQSSTVGFSEQSSTFSAFATSAQQATVHPTSDIAQPTTVLPSGTIVQEEDIIHQVIERFQLSAKQLDNKINIKLHPAELGELKIDLTVKDGSIRAHVVAQSQHTREILEKNVQKLKNQLESQGYTVDNISVTAESESVADFDLFEQQLFNRQEYSQKSAKSMQNEDVSFNLEGIDLTAVAASNSVNVKI